ncbi:MAG: bifunctional riboflavin kinase/FAD synthetase [Bacteroidota bacterium]|nr:bifunctional riboflavin kinase/FAD synthetase [Bacteroidota bacterium]
MIKLLHGSLETEHTGHAVTVGSFDGVHVGHQAILKQLLDVSAETGSAPLVASFDPHPRTVLSSTPEQRLTTLEERSALLADHGVSTFACLSFSVSMSRMAPESFVEEVLVGMLHAKAIVVGHDHRFGKDGKGDIELLRNMQSSFGFALREVGPVTEGGKPVSSSRIRTLLDQGDVRSVSTLLARYHSVAGTVVRGAGRGQRIGVPTANLMPVDGRKVLPAGGVYAVRVWLPEDPSPRMGMMNIGHRPTFDSNGLHLEVNVLDWSGDLYGREVRVEFVERVRNEQKFKGIVALVRQLNADRDRCRSLLKTLV